MVHVRFIDRARHVTVAPPVTFGYAYGLRIGFMGLDLSKPAQIDIRTKDPAYF